MSEPVVTGRPAAPGGERRILAPARYRHPGDVIRLIIAGLVLVAAVVITSPISTLIGSDTLIRPPGLSTRPKAHLMSLAEDGSNGIL
jgi:hypothetical protein